eukprot:6180453-Pyramimonas_sp.AAC.2
MPSTWTAGRGLISQRQQAEQRPTTSPSKAQQASTGSGRLFTTLCGVQELPKEALELGATVRNLDATNNLI